MNDEHELNAISLEEWRRKLRLEAHQHRVSMARKSPPDGRAKIKVEDYIDEPKRRLSDMTPEYPPIAEFMIIGLLCAALLVIIFLLS